MGKGNRQKGNKNVFKVAGARSLKAKNKAKAVTTQLKKLSQVTKQETEKADKLLGELQETVRQAVPEKLEKKPVLKVDKQSKIDQYKKTEESSVQALDKLNKMEVAS